jgi:hypothetical protein
MGCAMKLSTIYEGSGRVSTLKKDSAKAAVADKAADLSALLNAVKLASGLDEKKAAARKLADGFKVGGKDKFLTSLGKCSSSKDVDFLCYNAALKGEGNGVHK